MTKTLMLMRHGKSSWKEKSAPDEKRPLKKRGQLAASMIGRTLKVSELIPDLILSSPAKRALDTANIVAKESGYPGKVQVEQNLYMAEIDDHFKLLHELSDDVERVMIVGHNPGLEALLQFLDGHVDTLPTGSLAIVKLSNSSWSDLNESTAGDMVAFWDPEHSDAKGSGNQSKDKK